MDMWAKTSKKTLPSPFGNLYDELKSQLSVAEEDYESVLERAERSIIIAKQFMDALRKEVAGKAFDNTEAEMLFFKEVKPLFFSEIIYYTKLYQVELRIPTGSNQNKKEYYLRCLLSLNLNFEDNAAFYQYYRSGATYMDVKYFRRGNTDYIPGLSPGYIDADPEFSTGYDIKAAKLISNERLSSYLNNQLKILEGNAETSDTNSIADSEVLAWETQLIYLVELIYSLYAFAPFDKSKQAINPTLLARYFAKTFHVKIDRIHKKFEEIRMRKKNRTVFLDLLRSALIRQMDEDDLNAPSK